MNPQAIRWRSLESVTWAFREVSDHLAIERGTMAERLSFCARQLSMLQPKLLLLPGSLTQELAQLIADLQAGRYERDPSLCRLGDSELLQQAQG